jgi:hypothetical protein
MLVQTTVTGHDETGMKLTKLTKLTLRVQLVGKVMWNIFVNTYMINMIILLLLLLVDFCIYFACLCSFVYFVVVIKRDCRYDWKPW